MEIKTVWSMFFTGTGTTKRVVEKIAAQLSAALGTKKAVFDFSVPSSRERFPEVAPEDLVVFGTPTIAGRVPNVLLKYLATIRGNGALAIPVVLYGNRAYDDSLIELRDILATALFRPYAAAAFVGEHSFSTVLAAGRPDEEDLQKAADFAKDAARKAAAFSSAHGAHLIQVPGNSAEKRIYYQPRDREGTPIDIRKVKPVTDQDKCANCLHCAALCPMEAISWTKASEVPGICIKCGACVKLCPRGAKSFSDANFLYHKQELEAQYLTRKEPETFL